MSSPYFIQIDPTSPCNEFDTLKLPREYSFPLDPFQKHAICAIEKGHNVLVTAKTGSGKTLVGEHLIAHMLAKDKRVFYTTPIKSLSNQKFHDLKQMFPSVGILTGDIKYRPDAQVVIMTTEILRNLLYKDNSATKTLGLSALISLENLGGVVFDECHYINDADRGKVWEETMILLDPGVQQVLLSATIDKPELFAQWLGDLKKVPMHLISTTYRIVPLRHQVMIGEQPQMVMDTYYHDDSYSRWIQWRNQKVKDADQHKQAVSNRRAGGYEDPVVKGAGGLPSYTHQLNTMVDFLDRKTLLPAIFFVFSRNKCEEYAGLISKNLLTSSESASIKHIWNFHLHSQNALLETMPQAHTLLSLLQKGIAFHHSGLVPILREVVEILFGKGLVKVLFATETFAVGINMPTKTVVFTDLEKYTNGGRRLLTTDEYLQMAGRAGRRGKDTEGHVFYLPCRDPVGSGEIKRMMTGVLSPITSRMDFHYDFLLKALQNPTVKYEDVLEKSYWMEQTKAQMDAREKEMEILKKKNKELGISEDELLELFEWEKLKNEMESSVNAKRKKATKLFNEWEENHSGPKWKHLCILFATWKKNDTEVGALEEQIRLLKGSSFRIQKKIDFLEDAGFIREKKPTLRGILATEVNEGHGLLLSGAVIMDQAKNLDCEELVCFLAGFLGEGEKAVEGSSLESMKLSKRVLDLLYFADDYAEDLIKLEAKHDCESPQSYWMLQSSWIDIARRWYTGEDASAICAEYGIYEGNFIRAMLKLGNLIEEWMNMLTYLQYTEELERYKDLKDCILRGIVKPQSLYLTL